MIFRQHYLDLIQEKFRSHPVVALLGPRQSGKTTLARQYAQEQSSLSHSFDLEDMRDVRRLENPYYILESLEGLVIIDEIQKNPGLFSALRVLVDQKKDRKFLILGSASRELTQKSSESLAGRIAYIEVSPFSLLEVDNIKTLHFYGGFPNSYLFPDTANEWLENYIMTFLEKDIPNLGFGIPPHTMHKFWSMLTHYHANIFNASDLGRSLNVSDHTVKHYLEILSGTFMIRQLQPWYENIQKRQSKRPKIYFQDSGILHHLLNINTWDQLMGNAKSGASFEGFVLEQIIRILNKRSDDFYYWNVHEEAELDLFTTHKGYRLGFECKFSEAPQITKSMHKAIEYLHLDALYVVAPTSHSYKVDDKIHVLRIEDLGQLHTNPIL